MGFRVSATTGLGGGVIVIVTDAAGALAKAADYREDGFTEILVKDLDGRDIALEELATVAGRLAT